MKANNEYKKLVDKVQQTHDQATKKKELILVTHETKKARKLTIMLIVIYEEANEEKVKRK